MIEILYAVGSSEPDIAFLRVNPTEHPEPFELGGRGAEPDEPIAAVGYAAWDGERNDAALMDRLFGGKAKDLPLNLGGFRHALGQSADSWSAPRESSATEPANHEFQILSLKVSRACCTVKMQSGNAGTRYL